MILHVASQKVKTAGCIVDIGYVQGDIDEIGDGVCFLVCRLKRSY